MKMSTKGRYGLRVMTELAQRFGAGPVLVDSIAENQSISTNYIHVLVAALKSAGLVRSVRGPNGGYELTRDPSTVSALEVVRALEGPCTPVDCLADPKVCPRASICVTRDVWTEVGAAVEGVLGSFTLAALVERQREKCSAVAAAMYFI
jgi:Rrf2 family cysteine metabolism transcriptional repressor